MSTGSLLLLVVAILVLGAVAFFVVIRVTAPLARRRLDELAATPDLADAELSSQASSFGVASGGPGQGRGLGVLALHATTLRFRPVAGKGEVDIDRATITEVTTGREFLGKTHNVDLMVVTWMIDDTEDRAAWRLAEPEPWLVALRR